MIRKFAKCLKSISHNKIFLFSQTSEANSAYNPIEVFDIGDPKVSNGSLIIIPTPIGNLRDLSIRQYENLLNVDIIACEDTRVTGNLLNLIKKKKIKDQMEDNFGVKLKDLNENESQKNDEDILEKGEKINLVQVLDDEEKLMKEIIAKMTPGTEIKDYETRKKLREEMRIKAIKAKAKKILDGVDTLSFLSKSDTNHGEEDIYGLEDDFLVFMKKKIAETRAKKGRGILLSYHKYNEDARINKLIKVMKYGFKIGLVSDAGTPTISDPGYKLIQVAIKEGIKVEALPGPNAIVVALSLSGFPSDSYTFEGYLSKTQDLKLNKLLKVRNEMMTAVFFESSQRLEKTLISIEKVFGKSQMLFVAFELTKLHQKTYRKTVRELINLCNNKEIFLKGEITLVISPFIRDYNVDIPDKKPSKEELDIETDLDERKKKMLEEEEKSKVFEKDKRSIHEIDENHLISILNEKFDITDKQMAEVLEDILKLSKTRSMHLVRKFRTENSMRTSKILNLEDLKF